MGRGERGVTRTANTGSVRSIISPPASATERPAARTGIFDHFTARLSGGTASARTATHRREQAELVVGGEAVIGFDVVVADREEGVRAVAREIGMAGDDRFPGRLDGPALGGVHVQPLLPGGFSVPGEEADADAHVLLLRSGGTGRSRRTT